MGIARGCEVYVIREGWEGLVRGNTAPDPIIQPIKTVSPSSRNDNSSSNIGGNNNEKRRNSISKGNFISTYGEGELLKEGEGEQTLKDRYIIRVSLILI